MMMPPSHQPPKRSLGTKRTKRRPSPSNTAKPMLPFAETPSASTIDKACPKTPTHPTTPQLPPAMDLPLPLPSVKTLPSPPNSSQSSTTNKPTTSQSHRRSLQFNTSPTPPLHLCKGSQHHPHSMSISPQTPQGTTPPSPLDWPKQYSIWTRVATSKTLHTPSLMALSLQYGAEQPPPTKASLKPA